MSSRLTVSVALLLCAAGFAGLHAAGVSQQQAEAFTRKMALVRQQSTGGDKMASRGTRRTPFTEAEVNSWFTYHGQQVLPAGVTEPQVTIIGDGRLRAAATVDLEAIAKRRSTGGALDPWAYLGGRLPVTLSGRLHTQNGVGRFDLEEAAVSGVPVPKTVVQEMVSYYSRSTDEPSGVRLDEAFKLPAQIKQIDVSPGQAIVVQ